MYVVNVNKLVGRIAEKGYNQTSFAKEVGISNNTLRAYLKDYSKIPYFILARMAEVLECDEDDAMSIFFASQLTHNVS